MPVPSAITDLSTSPGSNSPSGGESITLTDDYLRTLAAFIAQLRDGTGQAVGSIVLAALADGVLAATTAGRLKMADGYVTGAKLADGALTADTTGRLKMADGFLTLAKLASGFLLPVTMGGTGATTAAAARTALGVPAADGTGATGAAWPIGITGKAATAGAADTAAALSTTTGTAPIFGIRAWLCMEGVQRTGTYTRTGTLITVTMTDHGFSTGMRCGLDFTSGAATDGTYAITVLDANTYAVTDTASGTTSGNVSQQFAIRASGNISGVARNSQGVYTVTFATALPDAEYAVAPGLMRDNSGVATVTMPVSGGVKTATQCKFEVRFATSGSDGSAEAAQVMLMWVR